MLDILSYASGAINIHWKYALAEFQHLYLEYIIPNFDNYYNKYIKKYWDGHLYICISLQNSYALPGTASPEGSDIKCMKFAFYPKNNILKNIHKPVCFLRITCYPMWEDWIQSFAIPYSVPNYYPNQLFELITNCTLFQQENYIWCPGVKQSCDNAAWSSDIILYLQWEIIWPRQ